jgi:hypothetical protein
MGTTDEKEPFADWAILELMGHRRLGGFVREEEIAGAGLLRIDIPCEPPVTQFYSPAALYCLTPTTEEIARALAQRFRPEPVHRYELPAETTITAVPLPREHGYFHGDPDDDDDDPTF